MSGDLLNSLRTAVDAAPDDVALRMHLARLLSEAGHDVEAIRQAAAVLQRDPEHAEALALIGRRGAPPVGTPTGVTTSSGVTPQAGMTTASGGTASGGTATAGTPDGGAETTLPEIDPMTDTAPMAEIPGGSEPVAGVASLITDDEVLRRLDAEFAGVVPPMFTDSDLFESRERFENFETADPYGHSERYDDEDDLDEEDDYGSRLGAFTPERSDLTLADVAGLDEVKARLEAAFLAPIRNPELVRLYGKSLRGGLLLYGPPGCGKTFVAKALAGEMGAKMLSVSLADVLDKYIGQSERNLQAIFEIARHNAPCVIFLDEIDALGQKRAQLRNAASRGTVNQLLTEMDGLASENEGVYVLGATNHPWDVDVALRRPGRFDRMVLVLPPDEKAREAVFRFGLRERPIASVDTRALARMTDGYSGADLMFVCEGAAERALLDSVRTGRPRMIEMRDLEAAVADSRPSIGPWLQAARNVAEFANADGSYDDLLGYLRSRKLA